ncbi:MAG TPA: hypothetical protein VGG73_07500 [Vicinamibacterales bacterium]|jgi:hypothetical protein
MANQFKLKAKNYLNKPVNCTYQAEADGFRMSTNDDTDPLFDIPANTQTVTVTVKPSFTPGVGPVWEETLSFSVAADGVLTLTGPPEYGTRVQLSTSFFQDFRFTLAVVKMSQFRNRTDKVLALLANPPTTRSVLDLKTKKFVDKHVNEVAAHTHMYGTWAPLTWDLPDVKAHFLDPAKPLKSNALNFAEQSLHIDVTSVVLERAGVRPVPQYFAVTWPKAIAPHKKQDPAPFLLFIRQTDKYNYAGTGVFVGPGLDPYPENFDYADAGLFETLHYAGSPLFNPNSKGVPYQAGKAGVDVVGVFPCNSYYDEFGDLEDPEETEKLLKEIQAFMFWKDSVDAAPTSLGKTAIAAFSSGTFFLNGWMEDDTKRKGHFLSTVVRALYYLDPMRAYVDPKTQERVEVLDRFIASALQWASEGTDKRIRLYIQFDWPSLKQLTDNTLPGPPHFTPSTDGRRTVSVVTNETWSGWLVKTIDPLLWKVMKLSPSKPVPWLFVHHAIGATMLTHALKQGDFP